MEQTSTAFVKGGHIQGSYTCWTFRLRRISSAQSMGVYSALRNRWDIPEAQALI